MSGSGNENEPVDAKEVGNDVDETENLNLNDEMVDGDAKEPRSPQPGNQETIENGELKTEGIYNVAEDVVDEIAAESKGEEDQDEQIHAVKTAEVPDFKSAETSAVDHDDSSKAASDSYVQKNLNAEFDANGAEFDASRTHDEYFNVKFKSEDVVNEGSNEVIAIENGEGQANVKNEEKLEVDDKVKDDKSVEALNDAVINMDVSRNTHIKEELEQPKLDEEHGTTMNTTNKSFLANLSSIDGYESGTEEEQAEFAKEVKTFYRENNLEYKAPKFYKEELNLLKLWRAVIKLGGYDQVTTSKLWRQVGESFKPPKTCTTVSWTFRIFYEKALLEYEKYKMRNGELPFSDDSLVEPVKVENQVPGSQALVSGRARRDAAARAMQGWHSHRLLGNGEDKNLNSALKGDRQLKTNGVPKRKKPSSMERGINGPYIKQMRLDSMVIDIGPPADWVKINVQKTSDCFEIYALVPGLLREEVHVQSDPAGRLIISGEPEQVDNPWGVAPFKKVVSLPSRIDAHQTSAVVTLHGQLFVRVPFEQSGS